LLMAEVQTCLSKREIEVARRQAGRHDWTCRGMWP